MLKVAPDIQYSLLGRLPTTDQEFSPVTNFSVLPSAFPPATSRTCRYIDNTGEQNKTEDAVLDFPPDYTLLGVTDTKMKPFFAQSGLGFPQSLFLYLLF